MNIHFKTAWDSIVRSPFQAMAAIFVLTLTFFVGTFLAVLIYSSGNLLTYFETRPQIIAFLKEEITSEAVSALQNKLLADTRVKEVRYVAKEEALEIYKKATSDNPLLSELVSPSIFPASLEFSVTDLNFAKDVIEEVKGEAIVDQVGFTASLGGEKTLGDVVERLRSITWYLRVGGGVFAGVLVGASFLVLLIIISMRMAARRSEIEILDLIGATGAFIRGPVLIEALTYTVTGVFLGWILAFLFWLYLAPNVVSYFGEIPVLPKEIMSFVTFFAIILAVELSLGLLLAIFGGLIAVSRAKKSR